MTAECWANRAVVVLGAKGMLGHELILAMRRRLGGSAAGLLFGYDLPELDICDEEVVRRTLLEHEASVVINSAAYTNVDGCETNRELAAAVNGDAPGTVARACAEVGAAMVHFGTDFIFDGQKRRPYVPDDQINPLSVYGETKWAGEQAILGAGCPSLVIRTSWLFGKHGRNFVEAILARAEAGQQLRVVTDQVGRPTLASDLAGAVVRLLDANVEGTVHFANSGECSWFGFAEEIVRQAGVDATVHPITSDELSLAATRPAYSVLDLNRYVDMVGDTPPMWDDALRRYLHARRAGVTAAAEAQTATDGRGGPDGA